MRRDCARDVSSARILLGANLNILGCLFELSSGTGSEPPEGLAGRV